jgi:hypothetical protein
VCFFGNNLDVTELSFSHFWSRKNYHLLKVQEGESFIRSHLTFVSMPTFTPITLDRFFEPGSHNLSERSSLVPAKVDQPIPRHSMSPALYATPETTPLPPDSQLSPSSFSPVSPYVINHKRRGPLLLSGKNSQADANCGLRLSEANGKLVEEGKEQRELMDRVGNKDSETNRLEVVREEIDDVDRESEADEFFELNESLSIASEDASGVERSSKPSTSVGEFFYANEGTLLCCLLARFIAKQNHVIFNIYNGPCK